MALSDDGNSCAFSVLPTSRRIRVYVKRNMIMNFSILECHSSLFQTSCVLALLVWMFN